MDQKPVALFDFDETLFRGDSLVPFLIFVLRHYPQAWTGVPRMGLLAIPYSLGLVSKEQMKKTVLQIWAGVPKGKRPKFLEEFFEKSIAPRIYAQGFERVRWHRHQGHLLVMASASMDVYLETVSRRLEFDRLICTRTVMEPTPRVVGANCYGEEKIKRLAELDFFHQTDWQASWAYSDHVSDLPMLKLCGHPVATTPHRKLRRLAQRNGWEVVDWS